MDIFSFHTYVDNGDLSTKQRTITVDMLIGDVVVSTAEAKVDTSIYSVDLHDVVLQKCRDAAIHEFGTALQLALTMANEKET